MPRASTAAPSRSGRPATPRRGTAPARSRAGSGASARSPRWRPSSQIIRAWAAALGLADPVLEYKLSCADLEKRAPSLTLYVAASRALTCFGGICYALAR